MSKSLKQELLFPKRKKSMYLTAYEEIKDAIIYDTFNPGEFLSENSLAKLLNMSRTPIREALKKLSNEGLVTIVPKRGVYVSQVTSKDLIEIYALRISLECLALKTSLNKISMHEIDEMEHNWLSLTEQIKNGDQIDWKNISKYDNRLHTLIVEKCDNDRLKYFVKILNQQILRYQFLAAKALDNANETIQQHFQIIDLLKKKDLTGLTKLLKEHLESSAQYILDRNILH